MRIRIKVCISTFIMLLCTFFGGKDLKAQTIEAAANEQLGIKEKTGSDLGRGDYRARISDEYIKKFSSMSDDLALKEEELESLTYRIEAVKERGKAVKAKEQKDLFKDNIKTLKINQDQLESEVKLIKKALRILQENKSQPDPQKMRALNDVESIESEILNIGSNFEEQKEDIVLGSINIDKRDVYENPPKKECRLVFNGIDATTKKLRKEVAKEFLFGYTHPKLKSYFKDKNFLSCSSKIVQLGNKNYMWLYITIASKDARKTYGIIEKNSTLKFELLSGDILYAQNTQYSSGQLEAYTGNTNYVVILPLDKTQFRQLSKGEIDRIGIMWSSGYEQYEVYNVDLVMNQIECLNQN